MALQHTHDTTPFASKTVNLIVLCDGLSGPANIGGLFRLCDAFNVNEIIFCDSNFDTSSRRLQRTARNTVDNVPYRHSNAIVSEIEQLKQQGYQVLCLELAKNSVPLSSIELSKTEKSVLVLGNEQSGISEAVLQKADKILHIEMYGQNSSMNVVQAAAIALYSLTKY
ncbi:TrmH family RNA methyltransferase [Candidatus Ulvibacter alkanivorans]|uniref:TrmH family RNA methyltransferase n=1 Tax=Candidatus Ulvibacter alkanivorans TaxID=2267620 RepID=UPI000DF3FD2D|nr:TrmH family RNA methyltransferase [Candidatus Ulvibacter alkanivorans]